MRHLISILCYLLAVCHSVDGQPARIGERRALVVVAASFVGVRETGNNRGAVYTLFMKPYGYGPGTMYCGLFCHHVFVTAGVKHGVKGPALAANWAIPRADIIWRYGVAVHGKPPPLSGDLALFTFGSSRIRHIEMIVNWPLKGADCYVIGGNTSDPSDSRKEGVFLKRRKKAEMIVVSRVAPLIQF